MRPSLTQLFAAHENVNCTLGTDKNTVHSYSELYEALFTPRRDSARAILEIGVCSGASVLVWAEYFSTAIIVGADITLAGVRFGKDHPRIRFVETDATSPAAIAATGSIKFDVILDDASHDPTHQITSAKLFVPSLAPGGLYIIEDIHEAHATFVHEHLTRIANEHGLSLTWHDLRNKKRRFDDIVAVLERPTASAL
jgi:predicted O-methyltransferase YrrM